MASWVVLLLVLPLAAAVTSPPEHLDGSGCPKAFDMKCHCGEGRYPNSPHLPDAPIRFIVNCTNTGFTNASMLQYLPEM